MEISKKDKKYTVCLICLTVFCLFADQNLMSPNLTEIAKYFHFNETERDLKLGGYIAFGFFILGAPAALIIGYLADTVNRCRLLGMVVIFGESACLGTYWVKTYWQLYFCRVLTGISIGGATPVIFSLLADYYSEEKRIGVASLVGISMSAGIAGGQGLAGLIGPTYGWRLPFIIVAVPSLLLGLLIVCTAKEPQRGSQERSIIIHASVNAVFEPRPEPYYYQTNPVQEFNQSTELSSPCIQNHIYEVNSNHYSEKIDCNKIKQIFKTPTAVIIFIQGIPGCVPWGVIYVFLNDYFSYNRGLSVHSATIGLLVFGIGGLLGQLVGGSFGQWLYMRDPRLQCVFMGSSTILATFPMLYLLNANIAKSLISFYLVSMLAGLIVSINGPNVRAVLQNSCAPEIRGTAFAIFTLTDDIGKGVGPVFVVEMLKGFDGNRRLTYNVAISFWILCGLLLLMLTLTVIEDGERVQADIMEALQAQNYRLANSDITHNKFIPVEPVGCITVNSNSNQAIAVI